MDSPTYHGLQERLQGVVLDLRKTYDWKIPVAFGAVLGLALLGSWRAGIIGGPMRPLRSKEPSEPGLFTKQSSFESFTTPTGYTYPHIRVFYLSLIHI